MDTVSQIHKAVLSGDAIRQPDAPPDYEDVPQIQLRRVETEAEAQERGKRLVLALEKLATLGGIKGIADPSEWQREVRQDRKLPGR